MKDFEQKISKYLQARGWGKGYPGDYVKSIVIESGELLEHFQWSNPSVSELKSDKEKFKKVQEELADIMIYCFDLSIILGLDTEKILNKKLAAVSKKYPAKLMKNRVKDGTEDAYWKIKKEHRMKGLS